MRDWFEYLPDFLRRAFSRAEASVGVIVGLLLFIFFFAWGKPLPSTLAAGVVVLAVMEGTYAAYRHERVLRTKRESAFHASAHSKDKPVETRVGGWLTAITASAKITVRPKDTKIRVRACWLVVYRQRRSWRSLWIKRRERIAQLWGIEPPSDDEAKLSAVLAGLPQPAEGVLPLTLNSDDDGVTFEVTFEKGTGQFGAEGKQVSGALDYEIEVSADIPDTVVRASIWWF